MFWIVMLRPPEGSSSLRLGSWKKSALKAQQKVRETTPVHEDRQEQWEEDLTGVC